jgi:outer membrane protein assembly factor BamA
MEISLLGLALVSMLLAGNAAGKAPQPKVGYIYIVGNEVTKQDVILKQLPRGLSPGQPLRRADLALAQRNLANLGIFETNSDKGVRPTVEVLDPLGEDEYKDVLIRVQETSTCRLRRMIGVNDRGELVASLVFEERNFDPFRLPTSWDDVESGRAFRGAGITLRLELVQVPVFPLGAPGFFRLGSLLLPVESLSPKAPPTRAAPDRLP